MKYNETELVKALYRGADVSELAKLAGLSEEGISKIRDAEIKRLFREGKKKREISALLHVSEVYVLETLKKDRPAYHSTIALRYQGGDTQKQIAEEFGISQQYVSCILKKLGIEARKGGRHRKVDYEAVGKRGDCKQQFKGSPDIR